MAWIASALAIAGYAAAAAGLAHDIQGFVSGETPWGNPGEWTVGALKAGGLGFAGGLVGGAIGPALGAASDALSIGAGTGTTAAAAGAPTGAASLSGVVPAEGSAVLGAAGTTAPESAVGNAVTNALGNAGKQAISGAATGALGNPSDPGRGAAMGAASGAAGGLVAGLGNTGLNAAFKGQESGFWNPTPTRDFTMRYQPPDAQQFSVARETMLQPQPSATMVPQNNAPGFGGALLKQGVGFGGSLAGRGASMGVNQALGPPQQQTAGVPNPYQQYPNQQAPYYTRAPWG